MRERRWRSPQRLRATFLGTMVVLSAILAWLGWSVLKNDSSLIERAAARREVAADLVVAEIDRRLAAFDRARDSFLAGGHVVTPLAGVVLCELQAETVRVWPEHALLFLPTANVADDRMASQVAAVAADALRANRLRHALDAFERLSAFESAPVAGMPAALAGRLGAVSVFDRQRDTYQASRAALTLDRELHSGRWHVSAATYRYLVQEISARAKPSASTDVRLALSEAVETVYERRQLGGMPPSGRMSLQTTSGAVYIDWKTSGPNLAVIAASEAFLTQPPVAPGGVAFALTDGGRYAVGGPGDGRDQAVVRLASTTGLPWTVQVYRATDDEEDAALRSRQWFLTAGLMAFLIVFVAGAWFVGQSVTREVAAARMQSDFVAAVSHEFRTPLTTLCQLSELLKRGRVPDEADRQTYYSLLHRESDRLRRLVDSLLAFGRLDARAPQFRFETVDPVALAHDVLKGFAEAAFTDRHTVQTAFDHVPPVTADREALRAVIWNLLENAVKYSPDSDRVELAISARDCSVYIDVRDTGIGIPAREHSSVFEPFVRGAGARAHNIRGTGIGLALARQIVRAHRGDIVLDSAPGRGSTFRVRLPASAPS